MLGSWGHPPIFGSRIHSPLRVKMRCTVPVPVLTLSLWRVEALPSILVYSVQRTVVCTCIGQKVPISFIPSPILRCGRREVTIPAEGHHENVGPSAGGFATDSLSLLRAGPDVLELDTSPAHRNFSEQPAKSFPEVQHLPHRVNGVYEHVQ